jgi:hypothetical protein
VSDAKPWTDARKWWMGILSALVIASVIAFAKRPYAPDLPLVEASLTGTYCGSYDNEGITEVLQLVQEGSAIKVRISPMVEETNCLLQSCKARSRLMVRSRSSS